MRQEEEKGVGMGSEGTLGLGGCPEQVLMEEEDWWRGGNLLPKPRQPPTPPERSGCSVQGSPQCSDTLVGSNPCYLPHRAF